MVEDTWGRSLEVGSKSWRGETALGVGAPVPPGGVQQRRRATALDLEGTAAGPLDVVTSQVPFVLFRSFCLIHKELQRPH